MTVGQNELRSLPRTLSLCRFLPVMNARLRGSMVFLTLVAVLMTCVLTPPTLAGQRVALVIGNASYAHAPSLANPLNDANDIGAALERLGFSVTQLPNASRAELWDGLQKFRLAASASEVAVVFYAGHGIEVDKRNFLIPVDARLLGDGDVEFEAVSLDLVLRAVEGASNFRLIILDACRDNPFAVAMRRAGGTRSIGRGLASVEPPGETLVAYAAKEGTVAADGEGRNSPYTTALLAHLEEPGLDVGLMFRKVRDAVLAKTGGHQEPFWYGSLSSEGAYLAALPEPEEPTPIVEHGPDNPKPGPVSPGNDRRLTAEELAAERVFWESVKDSTHVADFEAYLEQFPGGTYEALARNRLARLTALPDDKPSVQVAITPEELEQEVLPEPLAPTPHSIEAELSLNREERRSIQQGLAALGFDPGPADGLFGQRTRKALSGWQSSQGGSVTGHLSAEAAKVLLTAGEQAARKKAAEEDERRRAEEKAARKRAEEEARKREAMRPGRVFRDCPECPEMVVVPAGSFMLGSPSWEEGRHDDEGPQHRVTIPAPFAVGKYEVTFAEWDACVVAGGCGGDWLKDEGWGRGRRPVMLAGYFDAQSYVKWLSRRTGENYRLLSEAEWEYAARAGTTGPLHFGSTISTDQANYDGNYTYGSGRKGVYREKTVPVGSFPANGFGLHDVHGNVWEWVEDCWHDSYAGAPTDGSAWVDGDDCYHGVLRGGSWKRNPDRLRSAHRGKAQKVGRYLDSGVRIARTLTP